MRKKLMLSVLGLVAMIPMTGCQMGGGMDADAMAQPARPCEMDYLAPLVGKWKAEGEMRMAGSDEVMKSTGTNEISFELGGRYLVERMTMDMGDGKKMEGRGVWTWDPKAKKFRTWWFDDWSGNGEGISSYCPDCRTWCFKGESHNLAMGFSTVGSGCAQLVDDNTMKWCWKERIPWTPFTIMEMCGTSTKQ